MSAATSVFDRAFSPRRLVVYGATSRAGAMGTQILGRLIDGGFGGELILVSNRVQDIGGRNTVTSAQGSGPGLDHALIVLPAERVPEAIEDAARSGLAAATIFSSGFAEIGDEGLDLDKTLKSAISSSSMRVMGPNCLGFISVRDQVWASTLKIPGAFSGPVSIVGQSGSVSARLATGVAAGGTGLDLIVTIGNAMDVGPATLLQYLIDRETTRVVVLYLESLGPPEQMRSAIQKARAAGKEVVVLKSGRTEAGARTATSHTGVTATKDVFVDVLLREAGAIRADSVQEACDVSSLLARVGRLRGRVAIVAPSGGDCTLAADRCSELGIPLAVIREETQAVMRRAVPICAPANPIDPTTMAFRDAQFATLLDLAAGEPDVDYMIYLTSTTLVRPDGAANTLPGLINVARRGVPLVVGAPVSAESRAALRDAGIGLVEDSERVFNIVRRVLSLDEEGRPDRSGEAVGSPAPKPTLMGELQAIQTLGAAGVPVIETVAVRSLEELKAAAERLGYPLVLKGLASDVGHKSGLGLVKLNLQDWTTLSEAFADVSRKLTELSGEVVVQPAVSGVLAELLLGVVSDPVFGKHVTLGMGGVFTDFLRERVWARAPVTHEQASEMLDQLAIGPALKGARAGVHADAEGVVDALVQLSRWAIENDAEIAEVEINPLLVRQTDVVAVDALVSMTRPPRNRDAGTASVGPATLETVA